ncbi:MAG: N-acetylmuramoyl-L-alanine amidase [Proteobacteria bacterium]|nr:N-acetylmuramoyl-L-alanine amidase [Pseudomonadota bacterium]
MAISRIRQFVLLFCTLVIITRVWAEEPKKTDNPEDSSSDQDAAPKEGQNIKICLDPGHPSHPDDKLLEAMINRRVVYFLNECLEDAGYETLLTVNDVSSDQLFTADLDPAKDQRRTAFEIMPPKQRAKICNEWQADYFISVHHNFSWDCSVNNTIVLYGADERNFSPLHPKARRWARATLNHLAKTMRTERHITAGDQDLIGGSLIVLKETEMSGILTEASFYSNPAEKQRLMSEDYILDEANAICHAFIEIFGNNN